MATIAEQLTSLANTKTAIKEAIVAKGIQVADTDPFSAYPDKIGQIESGGGGEPAEEWQPNPNWWDIRKILDEDTRDYPGKFGVILYNFNDVSDFQLSSSDMTAVATSDGAFYSYANNGSKVSHNWDVAQDKDDGRGRKTRYVIYYFTTDTTAETFAYDTNAYSTSSKCGWTHNRLAYIVLRINCTLAVFPSHYLLEGIDNTGYRIANTSMSRFCTNCYNLRLPPENVDTTNVKNFSSFMEGCYLIKKLPEWLNTESGENFANFAAFCYSLEELPENLDTSNATNLSGFARGTLIKRLPPKFDSSKATTLENFLNACRNIKVLPEMNTDNCTNFNYILAYCVSLTSLPTGFNTANGIDIGNFLYNAESVSYCGQLDFSSNTKIFTSPYSGPFYQAKLLKEIYLTLPSNTNFWLNQSTIISIESFRYIADHAPDVTATPRTLTVGTTNISRINAADPTIITDLNAKGWTVA